MPLSKAKKEATQKLIKSFIKDNKLDPETTKIGFLEDNKNIGKIERLPTGLIALDVITNGGYVKGKINQVVGGESAGKTTMFLNSMGYWQKTIKDFVTAYIPAEKSFDREWATFNGCDPDTMMVYEPRLAEENLDFVMKCAEPDCGIDCLIIDTLQALASKKELYVPDKKSKTIGDPKEQSTEKDSMALLPRLYSQFLRMYTSKTQDTMTLILASQVRTDIASMARMKDKETGGNALKHYNVLTVKMFRISDSKFPVKVKDKAPPNSFAVQLEISKAKIKDRYKGNRLIMYFFQGSFDHKFNVLAIAKDLGIFDGEKITYKNKEGKDMTEKGQGLMDLYNKATPEAIKSLESKLTDAYTKKVMSYNYTENSEEEEEAL